MPKIKTRKAAAKRFKFTSKGKIKRGNASRRHLLESKSPSKKRQMGKDSMVSRADEARVRSMLPQ